jgi:GT2 family glycosyltransferase
VLDYSIIIPVFNKAEFTRNCLATLPGTLTGAGEGEIIVVDNASSDETPEVLAQFPGIEVIRNERNLGFAAANNQGARAASGRFLVLLNNDTQGLPGWLGAMLAAGREDGVGVVGARLLYPNDTIQHGGVVVSRALFSRAAFQPYHYALNLPKDDADANVRCDYQAVTGACLLTPRDLYLDFGGLDEVFWNGYEDVDYCFKVRARGLRVVYEPKAALYHFESKSGVQRFRKLWWNVGTLSDRWNDRVACDSPKRNVLGGKIVVLERHPGGTSLMSRFTPATTVVVHGSSLPRDREAYASTVRANRSPVSEILWCESGKAVGEARQAMEIRGERYVAFVASEARLEPGWLDELVTQTLSPTNIVASTHAPELVCGENVTTLATDARCTLLSLKQIPQQLELGDFPTLDGAVADLLLRVLELERGTRGVRSPIATLPPACDDPVFASTRGMPLKAVFDTDAVSVESVIRSRRIVPRGLVSIVTLSWNAPAFTKKALESIAACTSEPYEVIVVDNGSGAETLEMLRAVDDPHVRIIYNPSNRGYAGGNNQGMASARGDYVVLLNNDVIVTEGWLDGLLDPFRRIPAIGVTAPRSNKVVGHQQLPTLNYNNEAELVTFAARRRIEWARSGYFADRAIGLCLCIDRTLLDVVGGMDECFGLGNFEDDDFCLRTRAAGYGIYICDDVFIHHFGSQSFAANNVDYTKTMNENWSKFAAKWGLPPAFPTNGYQPRQVFSRGFDRKKHYVALPPAADSAAEVSDEVDDDEWIEQARLVLYATVGSEAEWSATAEFVKRFVRAFKRQDAACLAIGLFDTPTAETAAKRIERILARAGVDPESSAYVIVSDETDVGAWQTRLADRGGLEVSTLVDRSPSALRRLAELR